jgi:DNA-binding NarL/FixJ family response regulator
VIQYGGSAVMVGGAMRAGALGSILKGANQNELLRAIQAVANREISCGPSTARRVMSLFSTERSQTPQAFPKLTEREREILVMITQGRNHAEISAELFLSLKTAQTHVSNIFRKLQVELDRTRAAICARGWPWPGGALAGLKGVEQ